MADPKKIAFGAVCAAFPLVLAYPVLRSSKGFAFKASLTAALLFVSPVWIYLWAVTAYFIVAPAPGALSTIPTGAHVALSVKSLVDSVDVLDSAEPVKAVLSDPPQGAGRIEYAIGGIMEEQGVKGVGADTVLDMLGCDLSLGLSFKDGDAYSFVACNRLKYKYFLARPIAEFVILPSRLDRKTLKDMSYWETRSGLKLFAVFYGKVVIVSNNLEMLAAAYSCAAGRTSGLRASLLRNNSELFPRFGEIKDPTIEVLLNIGEVPQGSSIFEAARRIVNGIPVGEVAYPVNFDDISFVRVEGAIAPDGIKFAGKIVYAGSEGDSLLYDQLLTAPSYVPDHYASLPANAAAMFTAKTAPLCVWDLIKGWAAPGRSKSFEGVPNEIVTVYNEMVAVMLDLERAGQDSIIINSLEPEFTFVLTAEKYSGSDDEYYPCLTIATVSNNATKLMELLDSVPLGDMTTRSTQRVGSFQARRITVNHDLYGKFLSPSYCLMDGTLVFSSSFDVVDRIARIKRGGEDKSIADNKFFARASAECPADGYAFYFADFRQVRKIISGMEELAAMKAEELMDQRTVRSRIESEELAKLADKGKAMTPRQRMEFDDRVTELVVAAKEGLKQEARVRMRGYAEIAGAFGGFYLSLKSANTSSGSKSFVSEVRASALFDR